MTAAAVPGPCAGPAVGWRQCPPGLPSPAGPTGGEHDFTRRGARADGRRAPAVPEDAAPADAAPDARRVAARGALRRREPVLPEQSPEDTDAAWGEYPARDDDRLYRDRPPHWDDI